MMIFHEFEVMNLLEIHETRSTICCEWRDLLFDWAPCQQCQKYFSRHSRSFYPTFPPARLDALEGFGKAQLFLSYSKTSRRLSRWTIFSISPRQMKHFQLLRDYNYNLSWLIFMRSFSSAGRSTATELDGEKIWKTVSTRDFLFITLGFVLSRFESVTWVVKSVGAVRRWSELIEKSVENEISFTA